MMLTLYQRHEQYFSRLVDKLGAVLAVMSKGASEIMLELLLYV